MLEDKADFCIYYQLTALLYRLTVSVIFVIAPWRHPTWNSFSQHNLTLFQLSWAVSKQVSTTASKSTDLANTLGRSNLDCKSSTSGNEHETRAEVCFPYVEKEVKSETAIPQSYGSAEMTILQPQERFPAVRQRQSWDFCLSFIH